MPVGETYTAPGIKVRPPKRVFVTPFHEAVDPLTGVKNVSTLPVSDVMGQYALEPVLLESIYTQLRALGQKTGDGFTAAFIYQPTVTPGTTEVTLSLPVGYYCIGRRGLISSYNPTTHAVYYDDRFEYALCIDTTDYVNHPTLPLHKFLCSEEVLFTMLPKKEYAFYHFENNTGANIIYNYYAYGEFIKGKIWDEIFVPIFLKRWRELVPEGDPPDDLPPMPLAPVDGDPYYCPHCHLKLWIEGDKRVIRDDKAKNPYYGSPGHNCLLLQGLSPSELDQLVKEGALQKL